MDVSVGTQRCPKCDGELAQQTNGDVLTEDIAHHRETIREALAKLQRLMAEAERTRAAGLRLVVGTGLIREAVVAELATLKHRGEIRDFDQDGPNRGALRVVLRQA